MTYTAKIPNQLDNPPNCECGKPATHKVEETNIVMCPDCTRVYLRGQVWGPITTLDILKSSEEGHAAVRDRVAAVSNLQSRLQQLFNNGAFEATFSLNDEEEIMSAIGCYLEKLQNNEH